MIKKVITYTDYEGIEQTEEHYFHLNKGELLEMEISYGGLQKRIEQMVAEEDGRKLIELFKEIILKSYGEKTPDGKSFVKIDAYGRPLSQAFSQTEAFSELFAELATDDEKAAIFMNGVVPQALAEGIAASTGSVLPGNIPPIKPVMPLPHQQ